MFFLYTSCEKKKQNIVSENTVKSSLLTESVISESYTPKTPCICNDDGTTILNEILVKRQQFKSIEELKRPEAKAHIARSLCKWVDILRAEVSEAGIDEIVFDLSRINMEIQLYEKVPGDGQKKLNSRISKPKYARLHHVNDRYAKLPKWTTHTKNITKTEKMKSIGGGLLGGLGFPLGKMPF